MIIVKAFENSFLFWKESLGQIFSEEASTNIVSGNKGIF